MIKERYEAAGISHETFGRIIVYLKDSFSFVGKDHTESLIAFCEALGKAQVKFNLTPTQVAVLAYDAGQFSAILKLANGEYEDLDPTHLRMLINDEDLTNT